jgi:hypothetical protein
MQLSNGTAILLLLLPPWRATRDLETVRRPSQMDLSQSANCRIRNSGQAEQGTINRRTLMRDDGTNQLCGSDA